MRLLAFALSGLITGSFLTVVVHRTPRGEGLGGRSRCPRCGTQLRAIENLPLVSWLFLRGRCSTCGNRISAEYPLTELLSSVLFVGASLTFESLALAVPAAIFLAMMLAIALIDARHRIVPNRIVYPALLVLVPAVVAGDLLGAGIDAPMAFLGLGLYGLPLFLVALAVPGGMGMGDVKLAALIGLALGGLGLSYVVVAAGVGILGGGVGALVAVVVLRRGRRQQMPFGPYLAAGAAVSVLAGPDIADAYLSLVGLS